MWCRLAERLLEKESINLPEIIEVIGDRPFHMKESIRNYLNEMKEREAAEAEKKAAEEAEKAEDVDAAEQATSKEEEGSEAKVSSEDKDKK